MSGATPAPDARALLFENMVLRDHGPDSSGERLLRVLHLPRGADDAAFAEISDPLCFPFWLDLDTVGDLMAQGEMEPCLDPMPATLRSDSVLKGIERAERDRRWRIIEPLVSPPERPDLQDSIRRLRIRARIEELRGTPDGDKLSKLRPDKVVSYLRLFWRRGQLPNALVPEYRNRGAPGKDRLALPGAPKRGRERSNVEEHGIVGVNVTHDILKKLMAGLVHLKRTHSRREAYEKTLDVFFSTPVLADGVERRKRLPVDQLPSFEQFVYHTSKALKPSERLLAVKGPAVFAQRHRPRLGSTQGMAFGPGSVFQIDATIADLYLRCSFDKGRLLGRPVVYLIFDMYTRMIVGFFVALSGPSWETASWALENAFSDKVALCASLGIEIEPSHWPWHHRCSGLMGDRGWDHLCASAGAAATGLGYKLVTLPPYRPDLKGTVENGFNFVKGWIKWVPGAWRTREPGEPRSRLDGAFTPEGFRKFLALKILEYNRTHVLSELPEGWDCSNGLAPTPLEAFHHGCATLGVPQVADIARVRTHLLHVGRAHETDKGLRFKGLIFIPEARTPELDHWFARVKGRKWHDLEVRWRPGPVSRILVPVDGGERFIPFKLHPREARFEGYSFEEVADFTATQRSDKLVKADERNEIAAEYGAQRALLEKQEREEGAGRVPRTRHPQADAEARAAEARAMRAQAAPIGEFPRNASAAPLETAAQSGERPASKGQNPAPPNSSILRPNRIEVIRARQAARPADEGA